MKTPLINTTVLDKKIVKDLIIDTDEVLDKVKLLDAIESLDTRFSSISVTGIEYKTMTELAQLLGQVIELFGGTVNLQNNLAATFTITQTDIEAKNNIVALLQEPMYDEKSTFTPSWGD